MTEHEYDTLPSGGTYAEFESIGDKVEGRIEAFSLDGGTDFDGNPVPQLIVGTTDGNVIVEAGSANLQKQFTRHASQFIPGHGVVVTFSDEYDTKYGTKGKSFTVGVTPEPVAPVVVEFAEAEEPF